MIFTVCLLIGLYLPPLKNVFVDMVYRSGIIGVIYVFLAYTLKISEDINIVFDRILKKV
jgi:hypothetical protein